MILIITYILNIIDYIFTSHWINLYGLSAEANPIGRWMFEHNVVWVFKIFVVGAIFVVIGYLIDRHRKYLWISFIPLVVYGFVVMYHIYLFLIPIL